MRDCFRKAKSLPNAWHSWSMHLIIPKYEYPRCLNLAQGLGQRIHQWVLFKILSMLVWKICHFLPNCCQFKKLKYYLGLPFNFLTRNTIFVVTKLFVEMLLINFQLFTGWCRSWESSTSHHYKNSHSSALPFVFFWVVILLQDCQLFQQTT